MFAVKCNYQKTPHHRQRPLAMKLSRSEVQSRCSAMPEITIRGTETDLVQRLGAIPTTVHHLEFEGSATPLFPFPWRCTYLHAFGHCAIARGASAAGLS